MFVAAILAGLAVALLLATLAPRLSPVTQAVVVVLVGYVAGYDVWHADAGPVPLTLDRLALAGLVVVSLRRFYARGCPPLRLIGLDWAIALLCGWLTVSCLLNKPPEGVELPTSPLFRLIVSFWAPATLYAVLRTSTVDATAARRLMTALACLGLYLGFTAVMETFGVWALVFPRYIADPELGLHFGRARGPMLNSVSLGVHLAVCATAAWLLVPRASRPMQLFWLGGVGLMGLGVLLSLTRSTWLGFAGAGVAVVCLQLPKPWRRTAFLTTCVAGVLLTLTRSTWLGFAGAGVAVVCLQLPKPWRRTAFLTTCVAGVLVLAVGKDALVGLEREDSAQVSAHSAQQRLAFLYVSDRMFRDNPLTGVGFGRFYDKKLPYLTDRRQWFELESIRDLHHHNTILSLLVETGPLGLAAFLAVLAGFGWVGWRLAHDEAVGEECNRLGLLMIGAVVNYLPSAAAHDLTLVHSEQWLLFLVAGAATGCWLNQRSVVPDAAASPLPEAPAGAAPPWAAVA